MTVGAAEGDGHRSAEFVQSLERGLAVIKAFDADDRTLTLSDVARKTGLTRAAARRFLRTLAELGYVRTDGRQFSLRPRVLELCVARVAAKRIMTVGITVGPRFPAYATSMGRVLLANAPGDWLEDYLSRVT